MARPSSRRACTTSSTTRSLTSTVGVERQPRKRWKRRFASSAAEPARCSFHPGFRPPPPPSSPASRPATMCWSRTASTGRAGMPAAGVGPLWASDAPVPVTGGGSATLFRETTRAVYLESPGSLSFEVQDVPAIAAAAHQRAITVLVDNTWATPLFFKAHEHGADLVIQAGTKYIVGHSD